MARLHHRWLAGKLQYARQARHKRMGVGGGGGGNSKLKFKV